MKKVIKRTHKNSIHKGQKKKSVSFFHLPFWLVAAIICLPIFFIINIIIACVRWNIFNPSKLTKTKWKKATFSTLAQEYSPIPQKTPVPFKKIHGGLYNFLRKFIP